jgi:hypothetical protein
VGREDVQLALQWEALLPHGTDLKSAIADAAFLAGLDEIVDPEAAFRFVDSEGGALGDFVVPTRGVEGLSAGWAEWLDPWEEFRIQIEQHLDAGEGRVLSLVELNGRTRRGPEISQPAASITRVRDGLIVAMDFYMDRGQARRDAGLD